MRIFVLNVIAASLFSGCRDANPMVEVTDTRRLTYYDQDPPGNIVDLPPLGWRTIPPTQFRDKNFVAGPDEKVEIYLTNANGTLLDNANRWLGQFGLTPVEDINAFQTVDILGRTSLLVEAEGQYGSGMGSAAKTDYGLVGALRQTNGGLLTIKMIGPKGRVKELREEFVTYCETLRTTSVVDIEKETTESE